jgi:hypothetical protein
MWRQIQKFRCEKVPLVVERVIVSRTNPNGLDRACVCLAFAKKVCRHDSFQLRVAIVSCICARYLDWPGFS